MKSWRRPDKDKVSPETVALVLKRDGPCVAPRIDPAEIGKCSGRTTFDHVKDEPEMGVRAKSIPAELAAVCQGHSEDGMKAGHQWNTAHRPEMRDWIRRHPV